MIQKLASEEENLGLAGCFQPPEGRRENNPGRLRCATARPHFRSSGRDVGLRRAQSSRFVESGLQPWEVARKENRP
jgi:hypothetical protein